MQQREGQQQQMSLMMNETGRDRMDGGARMEASCLRQWAVQQCSEVRPEGVIG